MGGGGGSTIKADGWADRCCCNTQPTPHRKRWGGGERGPGASNCRHALAPVGYHTTFVEGGGVFTTYVLKYSADNFVGAMRFGKGGGGAQLMWGM